MIYINLAQNAIEVGGKLSIPYDFADLRKEYQVDLLQVVDKRLSVVLYSNDTPLEEMPIADLSVFEEILKQSDIANAVSRAVFEYSIENYIYKHYPRDTQAQDDKWLARGKAVIVALSAATDNPVTTDDVTIEIVSKVIEFFSGGGNASDFIAKYITAKPAEMQESYTKVLRSAIRTEWAKQCIDEAVSAASEGRESSYPPFPDFNKTIQVGASA